MGAGRPSVTGTERGITSSLPPPAPDTHPLQTELDELVAAQAVALNIPGAAVAVVHHGQTWVSCYGVTSTIDPLPVTPDTLFMIGSTTKTLTASAVMALIDSGRLSLDSKVAPLLPELQLPDHAAWQQVTVGQLLDHTSGWRGDIDVDTGWGEDALALGLQQVAPQLVQLTPPGHCFSYNNVAVMMAGQIVAAINESSYERAVHDLVLTPLAMTDTFFLPWDVAQRRMAVGHAPDAQGQQPEVAWPYRRALGPAGAALCSLRDQLRYLRYHLTGRSETPTRPPMSDDSRLLMQRPRVLTPAGLRGVGVSWLLRTRRGVEFITHGGNLSNLQVSEFRFAPEHQLGIIATANSAGGSALGQAVTDWALTRLLDRPAPSSLEPIAMTHDQLAQYSGTYDAGQWHLIVTISGSGLDVRMRLTDVPAEITAQMRATFESVATQMFFCEPDVVITAADPAQRSADFLRDEAGAVRWFRHGLRLAKRLT